MGALGLYSFSVLPLITLNLAVSVALLLYSSEVMNFTATSFAPADNLFKLIVVV